MTPVEEGPSKESRALGRGVDLGKEGSVPGTPERESEVTTGSRHRE